MISRFCRTSLIAARGAELVERVLASRNREAALAAFLCKKAEIDEMLARLASLSDNHLNSHPDGMRRSRPIDFCGFPTLTERRVSF